MTTTTFLPIEEHLGEFIKATQDTNNALLGFSRAYKAEYSANSSTTKAAAKDTYEWRAVNLFTGVNSERFEELQTLKDGLQVLSVVVKGVVEVVDIIAKLQAPLIKGVTQILLQSISSLIDKIIAIFNPQINLSALYMPPHFGKVTRELQKSPGSNALEKTYVNSVIAKDSLVESLNRTTAFLPSALKTNIDAFVSSNQTSYGPNYLINTLTKKLNDGQDSNRPNLTNSSHWCGFGIFLGSSLPNTVLSSWDSLNSILSSSSKLTLPPLPQFPPIPSIQSHKISELTSRVTTLDETTVDVGPVQRSIICKPSVPTDYSSDSVTYTFTARLVYFSYKEDTSFNPSTQLLSDLVFDVATHFKTPANAINEIQSTRASNTKFQLFSRGTVSSTPIVNLIKSLDTTIVEPGAILKSSEVFKAMLVVDVYEVNGQFYPMISKPVLVKISAQRSASSLIDLTYTSQNPLLKPGGGIFPSWYSAGFAVNILPGAVTEVVNFLDLFRTYIEAYSESVLDYLGSLFRRLTSFLNLILGVIEQINNLITLLDNVASLTTSLGASTLLFSGKGDNTSFLSMFKEYLSSEETRPSSIAKVLNEFPARSTINVTFDGLADVAKTSPDDVDTIVDNYSSYLRELRDESLENYSTSANVLPRSTSLADVYLGERSPMFTENDTTCGIIFVATSTTLDELVNIKKLLELLFEEEKVAPEAPSVVLARQGGLTVDTVETSPARATLSDDTTTALFTSSMALTQNTEESPFDFCK